MPITISAPVGLRNRTQQVTNKSLDQKAILEALGAIPTSRGGKREAWDAAGPMRPGAGGDGVCPRGLANAIWEFQAFWQQRGVFRNVDGVVDPDGNTLRQINKLMDEVPGRFRVFVGADEILRAYPVLVEVTSGQSIMVELTYFDVGSAELKPEHRNGIFTANLKGVGKDFRRIKAWGFHSKTGGPAFNNLALAERRAENAMRFSRLTGIVDATVKDWTYTGVNWQPGMPEGEVGEMRKVLLLFRTTSARDLTLSSYQGQTKTKRF